VHRQRPGRRLRLIGIVNAHLINCVRGWLRTQLITLRSGATTTPTCVRTVALKHPKGLPEHVERLLLAIDAINAQICGGHDISRFPSALAAYRGRPLNSTRLRLPERPFEREYRARAGAPCRDSLRRARNLYTGVDRREQ
jgi:hypothetical protein